MEDNNRNENRDGGIGRQEQEYDRQQSETGQNGSYEQNGPYQRNGSYEQSGSYEQYNGYEQYGRPGGSYETYNSRRNVYETYGQYQKGDQQEPGNGFGITAMILGILSLVLFCTCINIPLAIAAAVFAVIQMTRSREGRGFAIAGIVTGAISVILFVITLVLIMPFLSYYRDELLNMPRSGYEYNHGGDDLEDFGDYFDYFDAF